MVEISSTIAASAGKTIVDTVFKQLADRSSSIDKILSEDFVIRGRDMIIECPNSLQKYSLTFETKKKLLLPNKKRIRVGPVRRVNLRPIQSLKPAFSAITFLDDGFEIDLNKLETGETYILDLEYNISDPNFVDSLVYKKVAHETPQNGLQEYWMAAQLKHLKVLKQDYGYVDLRDIDFTVDVSIYQDIKMKIPRIFSEKIETIVRLTQPIGRSEQSKLFSKLVHQQKQKYTGEEMEILKNLQDLFNSAKFRHFIDIREDFYYSDCIRGGEFYEKMPFPTWPKTMKVISRTDLNFETPTAEGNLIYKKDNFMDEIGKIFKIK